MLGVCNTIVYDGICSQQCTEADKRLIRKHHGHLDNDTDILADGLQTLTCEDELELPARFKHVIGISKD